MKTNLKVGDKVYCIKNYKNDSINANFNAGEFYYIDNILNYYQNKIYFYQAVINYSTFNLSDEFPWSLNFNEYFITYTEYIKSERKQKLNKLL